ncbi:TetR/AcrR family transcriptional regulator [Streptomyces sp. NPDC020801]|uniref:TetR/AcrR family transcriptional regulator n=1 Tax=unclassified Streptomyces TaxID=2593676 RepID=UPI0037A935F0
MAGRLRAPTGRYGGKSAAERQAERRGRFLGAALQLFGGTPGYRATTVAALSEAAGLSTRQFYEEFRTLEDVLAALHLQVNDWAEQAVREALAGAGRLPLDERVAALFRAYAANVTADPRRIRITFVEITGVSARLEEQRLARRSRWVDLICAEAQAAVAREEAAPRDYRIAAAAFIGSVNGLLHDWSAGWVEASLDEVVDELVRQLLGILRPPGWTPPGDRRAGALCPLPGFTPPPTRRRTGGPAARD